MNWSRVASGHFIAEHAKRVLSPFTFGNNTTGILVPVYQAALDGLRVDGNDSF